MTTLSDDEQQILDHLSDGLSRGQQYFRSKKIAAQLGLSAKQVGVRLSGLADKSDDIDIEKWGRARSTTWRVTSV